MQTVQGSLLYPLFSLEKNGIHVFIFVSKSVRRPSVRLAVRASVTFLVNVSPPKHIEEATSNFVGE